MGRRRAHAKDYPLTQFIDLGLAKPLLKALADEGKLPATQVAEAIAKYGIKADKINPLYA